MKDKCSFKNVIFSATDWVNNFPLFSALRTSLLFAIPLYIIGVLCFVAYQFILGINFYMPSVFFSVLMLMITRIGSVCFISMGVVLTFSIAVSYMKIMERNNFALGATAMITSFINFLIFAGISESSTNLSKLSTLSIPLAIFNGLFTAFVFWHVYCLFPLGKDHGKHDPDNFRRLYTEIIPTLIITVLIAVVIETITEYLTGGLMLHDVILSLLNFDFTFGKSHAAANSIVYIIYKQFLDFAGVNAEIVLADMAKRLLPYNLAIGGVLPEISLYSVISVASSGVLAFALAVSTLLFSDAKRKRKISFSGIFPALLGVGEPVLYGLGTVLNPVFLIPYIMIPVVNFTGYIFCVSAGLFSEFTGTNEIPTMFMTVGFAASGIWQSIFVLIMFVADIVMFEPFVKMADEYDNIYYSKSIREIEQIVKNCEREGKIFRIEELDSKHYNTAAMLVEALRDSIKNHRKLSLFCEPAMNSDDVCIGGELLLRWNFLNNECIYPPLAVAIAEAGGYVSELDELIFDVAAKELCWMKNSDIDGRISVNLTAESLSKASTIESLEAAINKYDVDRNRLCIEISEYDAAYMPADHVEKFEALKNKGYIFIVDNYGGGHSSARFLQYHLFDGIKIDSTIISDMNMDMDESGQSLISNITDLSKRFDLTIIAGSVPDVNRYLRLKSLGVRFFQGKYISTPLDIDSFEEFFLANIFANKAKNEK